jgi:signal peptidase
MACHRSAADGCKRIISVAGSILLVLVVAAAIWVLAERIQGENPSVFGYRLLRVATGSMTPEYEVGDVILVKRTPVSGLSVGDDITYMSQAGETEGLLITHRIISMEYEEASGEWQIQTQGIAEGAVPDKVITADQIYGKAVHICRILTVIYNIFLTKPGLLLFILPLILMMFVETMNLITIFTEGDAEHVKTETDSKKDEQA